MEPPEEKYNYEVTFSAHGSSFVYPMYFKSFYDAYKEAERWELKADTVGGKSQIKEVNTGIILY